MSDIATVGADFFRSHQGKTIALADGQGTVALTATLYSVTDDPRATMPNALRQAFSLVLVTTSPSGQESGHFTLGHPDFGAVGPVYIVRSIPGQPGDSRAWFRVYFS